MFSVEEYKRALSALRNELSETELGMLREQYAAPRRSITAKDLAAAIGIAGYQPINGLYGRLGHRLSNAIGREPRRRKNGTVEWWTALSSFGGYDPGLVWVMHDSLAQALKELNVVHSEDVMLAEEVDPAALYHEGAVRQIVVNSYERNTKARQQCIAHYGTRL
jgi:5-methylcytosine-specific restriction enzyme A